MGKKKKHAKKNKIRSEKIKKIDDEIYSKKLMELEDVIYTYSEKELLEYFLKEFIYGQKKEHYKKSLATLYDLDIECLEYAIYRFSHIDKYKGRNFKNYSIIASLFGTFLMIQYNYQEIKWVGLVIACLAILQFLRILDREKKDRDIADSMLTTFEKIYSRKEKGLK
ncbi:hypothetical protein KN772_16375 [Bacillus altitudinis]|uniref:hypothetical protein n=2 Tax=Bacillus altitudinis TaxID=293387 RepID=UPI001C5915E2|nr:hypothetical protein [Bacillus altitudinis]MBW2730240.1 hypothetical protein [Bacillus altitudinis]